MTIEPRLLEQYLPDDPEKRIKLAYPNGSDAASIVRREAVALIKAGMVCGIVNKRGYLRHMQLLVSLCAAMRIINRYRRPPVKNPLTITRAVQSGKRWRQRADRAKLGHTGSHTRFRVVLDRNQHRLMDGDFAG